MDNPEHRNLEWGTLAVGTIEQADWAYPQVHDASQGEQDACDHLMARQCGIGAINTWGTYWWPVDNF